MMLALLAFEVTVYRHQELYRLRCNKVPPRSRTLFHDISRHHLDQSVLSCAKYFLNYVFYKFGLEVSGRRHSSERHEKLEGGVGGGDRNGQLTFVCVSDLFPFGSQRDRSADGSLCRRPRLGAHLHPVQAQQEANRFAVAKVLLLPVGALVPPVSLVYWIPACRLQR